MNMDFTPQRSLWNDPVIKFCARIVMICFALVAIMFAVSFTLGAIIGIFGMGG